MFSLSSTLKWNLKHECTIRSQIRVLWLEMEALGLQGANTQLLVRASCHYLKYKEILLQVPPCLSVFLSDHAVRVEMRNLPFRVCPRGVSGTKCGNPWSHVISGLGLLTPLITVRWWPEVSLMTCGGCGFSSTTLMSLIVKYPVQYGLSVDPFTIAFNQQKR